MWRYPYRSTLATPSLLRRTPSATPNLIDLGRYIMSCRPYSNLTTISMCVDRYTVYSVQNERPGAGRPIISVSVAISPEAGVPTLSVSGRFD